jgi:spermidine synthase
LHYWVNVNFLRLTLLLSFAVSGFAGLIYESIWSRYLKLFLGHAAYAQTLVIALFMGGLSLGSWLASRHSTNWRNLLRRYALAEAVIGLLGLVFQPVYDGVTQLAYTTLMPALGSPTAVSALKLLVSGLLILPPSILLGMTFPLMSAGVVRMFPHLAGSSISMLYFTNSIGAAAGVLMSGFVLVEWFGLPGTIKAAAVLNLAVAAAVYIAARLVAEPPPSPEPETADVDESDGSQSVRYGLMLGVAALTGLASFVYEIGWIRMLSLVLGSSTHSFELMLSAFIAGLAFGGLWIKRRIDGIANPTKYLAVVQLAMGFLALATVLVYANSFELMREIMKGLSRTEQGYTLFNLASHFITLLVMFPATFCAGMTLPLITFTLLKQGSGEKSIGTVYAANTVGAIVGAIAATHIGMPLLGLKGLISFGAAIDLSLGVALLWMAMGPRGRLIPGLAAGLSVAALVATLAGVHFDPLKMASGVYRYGSLIKADKAKNIYHEDGKTSSVDLVQYPNGNLVIFTNGKGEATINLSPGGEPASDEITMVLSAVLPLAAHPQAKRAAVIGMGSGQTSHTLLGSDHLERVDTIEIEASVIEAARQFGPRVERVFGDSRSRIFTEDARTFLSTYSAQYDIIVAEPSNPWVSGVSSLFSDEFYELAARHLRPQGVLAQWLQLYEIEPRLVASVMASLAKTFSEYAIYATDNANMVILARKGGGISNLHDEVFRHPKLAAELRRHRIYDAGDLEARRIADGPTLQPLFDSYGVPANSDFYPFLDLHAVRSRFLDHSASGILALRTAPVPVLDILSSAGRVNQQQRRPSRKGGVATQHGFAMLQLVQSARAILAYFTERNEAALQRMPPGLRRDTQLALRRLESCSGAAEAQQWLQSLYTMASVVNPALSSRESQQIWRPVSASRCARSLPPVGKAWVSLFAAVGARDGSKMAAIGEDLLPRSGQFPESWRSYALVAAMAGNGAGGNWTKSSELWTRYSRDLRDRPEGEQLLFRLLLGHSARHRARSG